MYFLFCLVHESLTPGLNSWLIHCYTWLSLLLLHSQIGSKHPLSSLKVTYRPDLNSENLPEATKTLNLNRWPINGEHHLHLDYPVNDIYFFCFCLFFFV